MRTWLPIIFLTVLAMAMVGCNGVILSSQYSQLLDQTAALSAETAARAEQGKLTEAQKTEALSKQAQAWRKFQAARDGRKE